MARTLTKDDIANLAPADRLDLIAELWDSLASSDIPLPESHRRALDVALEEHAADPADSRSWAEVRNDLFPKK